MVLLAHSLVFVVGLLDLDLGSLSLHKMYRWGGDEVWIHLFDVPVYCSYPCHQLWIFLHRNYLVSMDQFFQAH